MPVQLNVLVSPKMEILHYRNVLSKHPFHVSAPPPILIILLFGVYIQVASPFKYHSQFLAQIDPFPVGVKSEH